MNIKDTAEKYLKVLENAKEIKGENFVNLLDTMLALAHFVPLIEDLQKRKIAVVAINQLNRNLVKMANQEDQEELASLYNKLVVEMYEK